MKRGLFLGPLLVAVAALAMAQSPAPRAEKTVTGSGRDEQAIRNVEEQLRQAAAKNDFAMLERLLADDYINTNPLGLVRTKAQLLEDAKSGASRVDSVELDDIKVKLLGDTAILTATRTQKSQLRGKDTGGRLRQIRVYVKRQGRWEPVAMQTTRVAE